MERGEYQRIPALRRPVPEDVKESLGIYKMKLEIDAARAARQKDNGQTR
ncbi:MAG: hypothetical protein OXG44_08450 [Gammaproteobacteria bacterium]|nr:hypothetical protein [Gammaproteobacteria bacterium]